MKDVRGFENEYAVTDDGRVFSKINNKFLNPKGSEGWYVNIRLCKDGVQRPFKVHRLIADAFLPNPYELRDVNHINGIKYDNRVSNLEWISRADNIKHAFRILKRKKSQGDTHPKSKLVLDLQTGIYYSCSREAAIAKCISKNNLLNDISNKKTRRAKNAKYNLIFV